MKKKQKKRKKLESAAQKIGTAGGVLSAGLAVNSMIEEVSD